MNTPDLTMIRLLTDLAGGGYLSTGQDGALWLYDAEDMPRTPVSRELVQAARDALLVRWGAGYGTITATGRTALQEQQA